MKGYGQFCPLALASEIVGERWTPLVLRELMMGGRRFNDIQSGVPRMSPSLLSKRLRTLQAAGILERRQVDTHTEYTLTPAGEELLPVIEHLAIWGKRWLPATLSDNNADPDLVMWDMHRRIAIDAMPGKRTVIEFEFMDQPAVKQCRWLVSDREGVQLCITDPGFEVDLYVVTDSRTMIWAWYGDISLEKAVKEGAIRLHGPKRLCDAFPGWLKLSLLADVPRQQLY